VTSYVDSTRIVVSHPLGNPNCYQVAEAINSTGCLERFCTCIYRPFGTRTRGHDALGRGSVRTHGVREWVRLAFRYAGLLERSGRAVRMADWVVEGFDRWVSHQFRDGVCGVWAYEDYAAATFQRAKDLGIRAIYDLPTVHYAEAREISQREASRDSSLEPFLASLCEPAKRSRRKQDELELADVVVCASSFVKRSVLKHGVPENKVRVLPYGTVCGATHKEWGSQDLKGPLRLLYVGAIAPHKGIHHLFEALSQLPKGAFELTMAGYWVAGFRQWLEKRYNVPYSYAGMVPHARLEGVYREAHLLVFPVLRDGFGLVLLEAMANGIPVLASLNCGAPDVVRDGIEGRLVSAGDVECLSRAIGDFLNCRESVVKMGLAARRRAETLQWDRYREGVVAICSEIRQAL